MNFPTITIGITAYNARDTILDALNSAVDQSVEISQIVIIDDKSSDDTLSIVEKFDRHPRVEIFQNATNSGVAFSRNEIIRHAKGEFIAFFDDDDISLPDRIEMQMRRILDYERDFAKGAPIICHTARKQIFPYGGERIEPTMGTRAGHPAPSGPQVARRALMGEPLVDGYGSCATCSQMARTSTYRKVGGFDAAFRRCGDSELVIRLARAGAHIVGVPEPLVIQKMTPTSDKSLEQLRYFSLLIFERHQDLFENEAAYRFCREWIGLKFDWLERHRVLFTMGLVKLLMQYPMMTSRRLRMAMPNLFGNLAFRRFNRNLPDSS